VPTGGSAFFDNALDIKNIISRVTGGAVSNIDGLLRTNSSANLFLINPSGIIFGPNAQLNIGGSILASTASSLKFADGTVFNATALPTPPLLQVSVPVGLQFGEPTRGMLVQGSNLTVRPGKTLAIVGGDVTLSGGRLIAPGGRLELGSVAGPGFVSLIPTDATWALGYEGVQNFQDIQLSGQAFVTASGAGSGDIQVQGRRVTLSDGSQIFNTTRGLESRGNLTVNAEESVEVIGTSANGQSSGLLSTTTGAGSAGNLTIKTERLIVRDGAQVGAPTFGSGAAGNVTVSAEESVEVIGISASGQSPSGLFANTLGTGDAGEIAINTRRLIIRDGAAAATISAGIGRGGNLSVDATESVELSRSPAGAPVPTGLFTSTLGPGSAGNLTINTRQLIVRDGAVASTATLGTGRGGNLSVNASDFVEVAGISADGRLSSNLIASTFGPGDAGDITITTGTLTVQDGALIAVSTVRSTKASLIIRLPDFGLFTVPTVGSGNAGKLEVSARSMRLDNGSITAATTAGEGGNITLQAQDLLLQRSSQISTTAGGSGNGGNLKIDTELLVALENSDITANAFKGQGGNIQIQTQGIFFSPDSDITASSELGIDGLVKVKTLDTEPSGELVNLPEEVVNVEGLVAQNCSAERGQEESEFIVTGRGGLPPNPNETLSSDTVLINLGTRAPQGENRSAPAISTAPGSPAPVPIVEAQGWVIGANGKIILTASAPNVTPHNPWLPSASCHAS
jgi:filamentous hemagglutinin family protein